MQIVLPMGPSKHLSDDNNDSNGKEESTPTRNACNPTPGSPVMEYLDQVKQKVFNEKNALSQRIDICTMMWIAPPLNPTTRLLGSTAKPDRFYTGDVWVYLWDPMQQYPNHMPMKNICPSCKSNNKKFNGAPPKKVDTMICRMWKCINTRVMIPMG